MFRLSSAAYAADTEDEPESGDEEEETLTSPNTYEHDVGQWQNAGIGVISLRRGGVYECLWDHARLTSRPRHWLKRGFSRKSRVWATLALTPTGMMVPSAAFRWNLRVDAGQLHYHVNAQPARIISLRQLAYYGLE